ncbi:hypothetical protein ACHAXS_003493 [Conticribra weissflogii]
MVQARNRIPWIYYYTNEIQTHAIPCPSHPSNDATQKYQKTLRISDLIKPLTQLTCKGVPFRWGPEQQSAFEKTKAAVLEAVMLTYPDATKPFVLYTDASNYAIGAILMQEDKAISCFS